jgi:chromosomal replication initiation ATPase DnaA
VTKDDREIVSAIRARLADRIGKDRCEVWFGAATHLAVRGEKLVVTVANQFFQDWLRSHFRKDLKRRPRKCAEIAAAETKIAAEGAPPAVPRAASALQPKRSIERVVGKRFPPRRDPRPWKLCDGQPASLDAFVVGNSIVWPTRRPKWRPNSRARILRSSTGRQDRKLICWKNLRAFPSYRSGISWFRRAVHEPFPQFCTAAACQFRRKYRDLELLAIDDVQFFTTKRPARRVLYD